MSIKETLGWWWCDNL